MNSYKYVSIQSLITTNAKYNQKLKTTASKSGMFAYLSNIPWITIPHVFGVRQVESEA